MSGAAVLMLAAFALGLAALAELLRGVDLSRAPGSALPALPARLAALAVRLQLAPRLARAGAPAWLTVPVLMWLKGATALALRIRRGARCSRALFRACSCAELL